MNNNIKILFNKTINLLKDKQISTPIVDAKMLLSYVLNINSNEIYLYFDKKMNTSQYHKYIKILHRRLKREPIANIIEKKSFWDYDFYVNKNVLTPRPDSETLISAIIDNYKDKNEKLNILDLGTGSGCLILTILKIYKNAVGVGVDINNKALKVAKTNAKILKINNIDFINSNWNKNIDEKFDIIISNPPYIPTNKIKNLLPEVNKYNPIISLDGGNDGLNSYRYIAKNIHKNEKKNTNIFLEIGKNQENDVIKIFKNYNLINIYKDLSKINRILQFKRKYHLHS